MHQNTTNKKNDAKTSAIFLKATLSYHHIGGVFPLMTWKIPASTKSTIKTKNNIFAIPAEAAATPPNPNTPAIIATIKNVKAQPNMIFPFIC